MPEIGVAEVKSRAVKGALALTGRTFLLQIVNFGATFLLTVFLAPEVFGVFFVVSAAVNFLTYFSDIGLAAALIQKKEAINEQDLKTTFTIQQALVVFLVVVALAFSGKAAAFYGLSEAGAWLFRALIFSFFLSSLKTIPSILLERKLDFNRLVIPQIGETIVFNLIAVTLAWRGFGVTSFSWAVVARGFSGLILLYWLSPWKPALALSRQAAKKLLNFGIPFQVNSLLALVKDDLLTVFLGKALTFTQVGYLGWAQKWANFPLRFAMDSVTKVSFPAYSRLQDNKAALKAGIEKALFAVCFLTFPVLAGLIVMAPALVDFLPRYQKWQPALFSLGLFSLQAMMSSVSTTLTNTLNATGRIRTTLKLMITWTGLTWTLVPISIRLIGFEGVAWSAFIIGLTVFAPIIFVRRITPFRLIGPVFKPLLASFLMAVGVKLVSDLTGTTFLEIAISVTAGAIIYLMAMLVLAKVEVFFLAKQVIGSLKNE